MTADPLGVGFVGAGPVTQAIHLPTLARLTELFTVVGATKQHHLADAVAALDLQLTDDDIRTLEEPYALRAPTWF